MWTRLASLGAGLGFGYIVYLLAVFCWTIAIIPFAAQNLLGIILCILSFVGVIFFVVLCIGCLAYAILGD